MSVRQFQNGRQPAKSPFGTSRALIPVGLFGLALLVYGVISGFSELRYDLYGKETLGTIRPISASGPRAWLGGYEFVVDGKTYTGLQQKMLREPPTVQYLGNDPATNRVEDRFVADMRWLFAIVSIFSGGLLAVIGFAQVYAFMRAR